MNRGDVLTTCFRDIQSQRPIRMAFVIMILFDVKDYRLDLDYMVRYRSVQRKYTHDSQDFCECSSIDVFGTKGLFI